MIPATPEPKIPENGPEPEFRRNFEPSKWVTNSRLLVGKKQEGL
jgi:hypothetical protein